jgi:L-fuculose-phosphate aldolase
MTQAGCIEYLSLKENLCRQVRILVELGLNRGSSGNCSIKATDGFILITPSGIPVDSITPQTIVTLNMAGEIVGKGIPSSEWRFHRDIYVARPEFGAIVHTHSTFSSALSCIGQDLPPFHYMIAVAGGSSIRCAPYELFGTQKLSDAAINALKDRKACLLANHGMIAAAANLDDAVALATEVEFLCQQYMHACQLGKPNILSETQMEDVLEKFKDYGNWSKNNVKENDAN